MSSICSEDEKINIPTNYFEFSKQMHEYLLKYIKSYKTETTEYLKKLLKIQEKYSTKIQSKEELKKIKNIDSSHIISLFTNIFNVIGVQITELQLFLNGAEDIIKSLDKSIKEKSLIPSSLNEYDEYYTILQKKYKDVEKAKNLFFEHAANTEDLLYEYYSQPNDINTNKDSNQSPIITKIQIDNSIKTTKKYENEYSLILASTKNIENKFIEMIENHNNSMKKNTCEIITNMKDNIINFSFILKNYFKICPIEIETYLPELINIDEYKTIEEIINTSLKKNGVLTRLKAEKYEFKLIPNKKDENMNDEDFIYIVEDKETLNTVKTMEQNFNLIVKNSISEINSPEKLRCRLLIYKLLSFSQKVKIIIKNLEKEDEINNNNNNIKIKEDYSITKEEVEELFKLLEKSDNRMIFLRKLNIFRRYGNLEFPDREFQIICDIFNKIIKYVKDDKNLEAQISIVILSETYYKKDNEEKLYILEKIKHNQIFHEKDFWFDFINKSILKEVQRNLKNDLRKTSDREVENMKTKKFEKLAFAQTLPIIKTICEFGLEKKIIYEILESLVVYYQLSEVSKKMLFAMVNLNVSDTKELTNKNKTVIENK